MKKTTLSILALSSLCSQAATISLTGFNEDLIAEAASANPIAGTTTDFSNWVFNEKGAPSAPASRGFDTGGLVTTTGGNTFQLASFTANNIMLVANATPIANTQLTFALADQKRYTDIQLFTVNQGGGTGTSFDAILVFDDASTTTVTVGTNRPDWIVNPGGSVSSFNHNGLDGRGNNWATNANFGNGIYLYDDNITLSAADQLKTLVGVQYDVTATTGAGIGAFAISGDAVAVPEPSSTALFGLGSLGLLLRRRK